MVKVKKTSISFDPEFLKVLNDYRIKKYQIKKEKIPTLSEAIRELIKKTLIPKEENTELPKGIKFEDKTISIEKARNRFSIRFNPKDLETLKEMGWTENTKVNIWISIKNI
jgi:hypothetical protein